MYIDIDIYSFKPMSCVSPHHHRENRKEMVRMTHGIFYLYL